MSQTAKIRLLPQHFQIGGPPILVVMVQTIISNKETTPEDMKTQLDDLFANWFVTCSISGELVSLCDLRYWNIERQEVYARPDIMPELQRTASPA